MTKESKINVVVSFTPEQMAVVSFEAEKLEMDVPSYLVFAAHRHGLFEQASEKGYEIFGRNSDGQEISQEEILYGEMVMPLESEMFDTANEPVRLPTADARKVISIDKYRQT